MERQSIFILLVCALCMCASVVSAKDPVTISVSGTGSVTIPPEYVSVSVGVETQAATASEALQANNQLATSATVAITGLGIDDDDLTTSSVSLNPVTSYNDTDGTSTITGFRASNTLSVTVRPQEGGDDLDTLVGEVLTELVNQGINTINDVTFKADNTTEAADAARTLAVDNAYAVASVFAKAACYGIVGVADMKVNDGNIPQPVESNVMFAAAPTLSTPISSGDITVSSSVGIDYFIEKLKDCDVDYSGK